MKDILNPPRSGGQASTAGFILTGAVFLIAAVAFAIYDAVMMAKGAVLMAPDIASSHLFFEGEGLCVAIGMAIIAAIAKTGWMTCAGAFLRNRLWTVALATTFFGIMLHIFSIVATTGAAGSGRDASIAERTNAQDTHKRALDAYNAARLHKASLPSTRPSSAVRADLDAAERDLAGAARADKAALRTKRDQIKGELAIAMDAERANAELAEASRKLDQMNAPRTRDPQAETIARYLPFDWATTERVGLVLPLLWSMVLEFGAPICALIATTLFDLARHAPRVDQGRTKEAANKEGRGPEWTIENQGWTKGGPARGPRVKAVDFSPELAQKIEAMKAAKVPQRTIEAITGIPRTTARRKLERHRTKEERKQA